jgi:hypothetical protein
MRVTGLINGKLERARAECIARLLSAGLQNVALKLALFGLFWHRDPTRHR